MSRSPDAMARRRPWSATRAICSYVNVGNSRSGCATEPAGSVTGEPDTFIAAVSGSPVHALVAGACGAFASSVIACLSVCVRRSRLDPSPVLHGTGAYGTQKAADQSGDFISGRIQREVSGLEHVHLRVANIAAISVWFGRVERQVVFAPENQERRLRVAHP